MNQTPNGGHQVVRFTAPWCAPCKSVGPIVDRLATERGLPLQVVDIEQDPDVAQRHRVTGLPTVLVLDPEGIEVTRLVGGLPAGRYQAAFDSL